MFNVYTAEESGTVKDIRPAIIKVRNDKSPVWIDCMAPGQDEMQQLMNQLGLHQSDVDHYRSGRKRPRTAIHMSYIYFTLHFLKGKLPHFNSQRVAFVLSEKRLVTLREGQIDAFEEVVSLIKEENLLAHGVEFLLYKLLNKMLIDYDHLIEQLDVTVEQVNNAVEDDKNILPTIKKIRQDSSKLINLIKPESRALRLLGSHDFPYTTDETEPYFADLSDQLEDFISELVEIRNSLNETIEAFTAIQSNEMSKVMQVLTIISTIFLPATLIASIYGMNFEIPEYHWKYGYPYAIGVMVIVAIGFVMYMKKRGWF